MSNVQLSPRLSWFLLNKTPAFELFRWQGPKYYRVRLSVADFLTQVGLGDRRLDMLPRVRTETAREGACGTTPTYFFSIALGSLTIPAYGQN